MTRELQRAMARYEEARFQYRRAVLASLDHASDGAAIRLAIRAFQDARAELKRFEAPLPAPAPEPARARPEAPAAAYLAGVIIGTVLHGHKTTRAILDPLFATYYAIPVFAFYPLFIVMFGLGDGPQVLIGFMLAIVAVIITTLNGLDRVPLVLKKTAQVNGLNALQTARHITLPFCAPYLLTAAKLALAYAFIGVIGSEFIMARSGMGYEISYAYTNFDNATMYPLILLILLLSIAVNSLLSRWEKMLLARRGQS